MINRWRSYGVPIVLAGRLVGVRMTANAVAPQAVSAQAGKAAAKSPSVEKVPFSYLTAATKARMAAQAPLVAAARRLQAGIEAGHATGFTGISLTANGVSVYWKGK